MTKLVAFAGSTRADSVNVKLAKILSSFASGAGADVTYIGLQQFELPIYNGDLESKQGLPKAAAQLKQMMQESSGMIIACPEYNGFMTPLLINTIAWCSRSDDGSVDLSAFTDKSVFVASASPGSGGGARSAVHLRTLLSGIGAIIMPQSLTVPAALKAFDDRGDFLDQSMADRAERLIKKFINFSYRFE